MRWQGFAAPVIFGFLASASLAQTPSSAIQLDVVAQDASGQPVKGLAQGDFTILDNGTAVAPKSFSEAADSATSVMLVLDLVNGPVTYATRERDSLVQFLRQNGGKLAYPMALAVLNDAGVSITPKATTDGNALADTVAKINVGPSVLNRVSGSAGDQEKFNTSQKALHPILTAAAAMPGRRLVMWLSPGWPLMSGGSYVPDPGQAQELLKEAMNYSTLLRQARIVLYQVNSQGADAAPASLLRYKLYLKPVNTPSKADFADLSLQVLATQTGGLVLNLNDIGLMLKECLEDAGDHYEVSFDPGAQVKNAPFHTIEVKVNRPGVTARTRNGYYLPR